ncbi:hypothetical protein, partial [Roseibium sp.]|uniref:hypothetical protein n=1 Tax=Roseibium sp. TaxID=1936156 RepID=UPI00329A4E64
DLTGECLLSAISPRKLMMTDGQKPVQSNSSTRRAANDPRYLHAAQLSNKSCDDTSFKTLYLFIKIKVLRPPIETTASNFNELQQFLQSRPLCSAHRMSAFHRTCAGSRRHTTHDKITLLS